MQKIFGLIVALIFFLIPQGSASQVLPAATTIPAAIATTTITDSRPSLIDAYFAKRHMPLAGYGSIFVKVADTYKIDWRLLPAIAVRESSGGLHACGFNAFGWGSCKHKNFTSFDDAIETVGRNLGGENPATARYYSGKSVRQILNAFNPPSIEPHYTDQVIAIMNAFGPIPQK